MNILFVAHEDTIFGASRSLLNIIDELKDTHNCVVVTRSSDGDMSRELKKRGVRIIPGRYYTWEIFRDPNKIVDLTWLIHCLFWRLCGRGLDYITANKIFKELNCKIDIIHVNSGVVDLGIALKKQLSAKLIWHLREFGKEDFDYKSYYPMERFYSEIDKADGIITISDAITNKFKPHMKHAVVRRIYNGVGKENIIEDKTYHLNEKEELVLLISGSKITKAKGQDTAVRAIEILANKGLKNLKLLIAGRGQLKDIGIEKIPDNVEVLGHVDNLNEVRRNVDIELVCSRCEAFGRVTVEAMLGGIPVIGANTGGTPELINDGETGYVYPYEDAENLAEIIEGLYKNRKRIQIMGKKAQDFAKSNFLIGRCVWEIEEFYKEIVERDVT